MSGDISSTFYACLFCTKANCSPFSTYVSSLKFLAPKFSTKNALVKPWWNWQQVCPFPQKKQPAKFFKKISSLNSSLIIMFYMIIIIIKKIIWKSALKWFFWSHSNFFKSLNHYFLKNVSTKGVKILIRWKYFSTKGLIRAKIASLFPLKVWWAFFN